jgi:hypothetical protein
VLSVRCNDRGFIRTQFMVYTPAMTQNPFAAGALSYTFTQRLLTVALTSTYYIRWTRPNGYQIRPPYGDLPNDPWFPRLGFNINPWAPEWARQLFNPQPPYLLATWVPGRVLSPSIIEFERKRVFFAGGRYPDVLIFDKDYNLKYALAGAAGKGLLYNWKYHQFVAIDPLLVRVQVAVSLNPTDICYGFYPYQEPARIRAAWADTRCSRIEGSVRPGQPRYYCTVNPVSAYAMTGELGLGESGGKAEYGASD